MNTDDSRSEPQNFIVFIPSKDLVICFSFDFLNCLGCTDSFIYASWLEWPTLICYLNSQLTVVSSDYIKGLLIVF